MKNFVHNEGNVSVISKQESLSTATGDSLISATPKKRALNKLRRSQGKSKYNAQDDDVAPTATGTKAPEPSSKMTDERNNNNNSNHNYDSKAHPKEDNSSSSSSNNSNNTAVNANSKGAENAEVVREKKPDGESTADSENHSAHGDSEHAALGLTNSNDSTNAHNSTNEQFNFAEAAKLWLKNGINGTAAAAFLTAATALQLPFNAAAKTDAVATSALSAGFPLADSAPIPLSSLSPSSGGITNNNNNNHNRTPSRNNGLSPSAHNKVTPNKSMAAAAATRSNAATGASPRSGRVTCAGKETPEMAIDYTTSTSSTATVTLASNGRLPTTGSPTGQATSVAANSKYGGRLQFFKDGKFILELACSKEGSSKGGWISVPRKPFRFPNAATSSSIVTPNSAVGSYAKNECSMSMSLSDDNSSIQSSPWQRDHNWKQTAPRCGISKEMMLYYRRPLNARRTNRAIRIARKKTRKPYDTRELSTALADLFEDAHASDEEMTKVKDESKNLVDESRAERLDKDNDCSSSASSDQATLTPEDDVPHSEEKAKDDSKDKPAKSDKADTNEKGQHSVVPMDTQENDADSKSDEEQIKLEEAEKNDEKSEAMNTSEDDVDGEVSPAKSTKTKQDEAVKNECRTPDPPTTNESDKQDDASSADAGSLTTDEGMNIKDIDSRNLKEEGENPKRLRTKTPKLRAKLNTVIQKLIDTMPTRLLHLSKTPTHNSSKNSNSFLANKFSPPSSSSSSTASSTASSSLGMGSLSTPSSTASRLVDYHHQHVSPRKRILRELEKVSLEDNASAAGGKRSRAKNSTTNSSPSALNHHQENSTKSPAMGRVHSSGCHKPGQEASSSLSISNGDHTQLQILAAPSSTSYQSQPHSQNSDSETDGIKTTNTKVSTSPSSGAAKATPASVSANSTPPTRLYSSYSIHSLLSGTSSGSSGRSSKKSYENQSALNEFGVSQPHQHQYNYSEAASARNMLSPKAAAESPSAGAAAAGGGKSPSNSGAKRRSPPYAYEHSTERYSPHAAPSRAPTKETAFSNFHPNSVFSPYASAKHFQAASSAGGIYSPFSTSPKYVPAPNASSFSTPSQQHSMRSSPRHHSISSLTHGYSSSSTPPAPQQAANVTATSSSIYIPVSQSASAAHQQDLSPQRSSTGSPQRESTPRTVPKKTASIRKQFASPTTSNSTNSSCPSPNERGAADESHNERKNNSTPQHMASQQHQSSILQHSSPVAAYYMYPPAASLNGATPADAHASGLPLLPTNAMTAYIPSILPSSYYNSYLSLTNKYYFGSAMPPPASPSAAAAAAAAARLSPSFPPMSIPYNGVNTAAMAAAAAAAAYGAQANMGHGSLLAGSPAATMAALYGVGLGLGGGGGGVHGHGHGTSLAAYKPHEISHNSTAATDSAGSMQRSLLSLSSTSASSKSATHLSASVPKMNSSSNSSNSMFTETAATTGRQHYATTTTTSASTSTSYNDSNAKDEQNSDVPLNLSKH